MSLEVIAPGFYTVVAASDERRRSAGGHPLRSVNFVVIEGPATGTVLPAFLVDLDKARWVWNEALENFGEDMIGRRFIAQVKNERGPEEDSEGWRNRVSKILPTEVPTTINRYGRTYRLEEEA